MPGPVRFALSFVVGLGGLLAVAAAFGDSPWSWLLWIVAGLAGGVVGGRVGYAWVALLIVGAFYPVAGYLGLVENPGPFWVLGAVVGVGLVAAGFTLGTLVGWRETPLAAARNGWHRLSRVWRRVIVAVIAVAVIALVAFTVYIGKIGSDGFLHPGVGYAGCDTPASRFGWTYEAINYDKADDAALAAANADLANCASQGVPAGDAIVTSDGVRLAGWYIPAANGIGPDGPTVLVAPGFNSNKSEILMFAPPFHENFNLVLMDLRNQGRSSPADVTLGLHEQRDVQATLDWLVANKNPSFIAAMGNSMSAATFLAEARSDTRIDAFILDSLHANLDVTVGNILEVEHGYPSVPGAMAMLTAVDMQIGGDVKSIDPIRTITQVGDRPVLLLHASTDRVDPPAQAAEKNFHAAFDAGVPVELHYCKGVSTGNGSHGHVIDVCPGDWSRWVNQFLENARAD
jgi:hypothetical protein